MEQHDHETPLAKRRSKARRRRLGLSLLCLSLLAPGGCGEDPDDDVLPFAPAGAHAAPDPMAPGPFPVGVTTLDLLDTSRVHPETGEPRFLRTEIWYPAIQSARSGPRWTYDMKQEADEKIDLGDRREAFLAAELDDIESVAVRGAGLARAHGPYPLVLFSHGSNSARFQYNFFTEQLASHGYIVAACDHQNNTLWDVVRDGFDEQTMLAAAEDRLADMSFVMNQMEKRNASSGDVLQGMIDIARTATAGHSYGGFTAGTAPCLDSRFKLSVLLAPLVGVIESFGCSFASYPVPVILLGSDTDRTLAWKDQRCALYRIAGVPRYLYELHGGGHFSFTGMCEIGFGDIELEGTPDIENDGCSPIDSVPFRQAQQTANHYAVAALNYHLRGSTDSLGYLTEMSEPPFDVVSFYPGDEIPDWPDGGCP